MGARDEVVRFDEIRFGTVLAKGIPVTTQSIVADPVQVGNCRGGIGHFQAPIDQLLQLIGEGHQGAVVGHLEEA